MIPIKQIEDEIRVKCIEANEEIVEVKIGCEVVSIRGKRLVINEQNITIIRAFDGEYEIIGRPLGIQDILSAMKNNINHPYQYAITIDGQFLKLYTVEGAERVIYVMTGEYYNLKETFENQTEDCLLFIHSVLCKDEK